MGYVLDKHPGCVAQPVQRRALAVHTRQQHALLPLVAGGFPPSARDRCLLLELLFVHLAPETALGHHATVFCVPQHLSNGRAGDCVSPHVIASRLRRVARNPGVSLLPFTLAMAVYAHNEVPSCGLSLSYHDAITIYRTLLAAESCSWDALKSLTESLVFGPAKPQLGLQRFH